MSSHTSATFSRISSPPAKGEIDVAPAGRLGMRPVVVLVLSHVQLFVTPWTAALCPWGFSRQEYWSELPFPPPGDLPHPRMEASPVFPALAAGPSTAAPPGKPKSR